MLDDLRQQANKARKVAGYSGTIATIPEVAAALAVLGYAVGHGGRPEDLVALDATCALWTALRAGGT